MPTPDRIDAFLEAAVPQPMENHRAGTIHRARELLDADPGLATASIATACVTGEADRVAELLDADRSLAVRSLPPRDWDPLLYLCFSRFLRFERERENDFLRCAKLLLENGADPNTHFMCNDEVETPLYAAVGVASNARLARMLLEAGADPDDEDAHYHVAEFENTDCFRVLFEYGVDEGARTTMLLRKLDFDDIDGVRCLLDLGADPNAMGRWGKTALHQSILRGRDADTVALLIERGADVNAARKDGVSAIRLAARRGREDVVTLLKRHGATDDLTESDRFVYACARGDADAVQAALAADPDAIAELSDEDRTAFTEAAVVGNTKALEVMLDAGFDIVTRDGQGFTALHWAAWHGRLDAVDTLIARGAPLEAHNGYGGTVLDSTVWGLMHSNANRRNGPEVIARLVAAGADTSVLGPTTGDPEIDALLGL